MLIKPGEHTHLAQLLRFMELGEQLAHDCAQMQCALAPERGMQTFLAGQARQERYHAFAFQGAIRWLAPKSSHTPAISDHMNQYRQLIEDAIARRDFAETLLAEQIILEGLGEAILKKIEVGLVKRGAPFQRLRRLLIHQEEAHNQFGLRVLLKMIKREEESFHTLHEKSKTYLPLAKMMLFSTQDAFYAIDEDPQEYWNAFHGNLPNWLQAPPQPRMQSAISSAIAMV